MCAKAIPNPSSMSSIVTDTQVLNNILLTHILHELMNNFRSRIFCTTKGYCKCNKTTKLHQWNNSAKGAKAEFNKLFIVDSTKRYVYSSLSFITN